MKISYDAEVDALYIRLLEGQHQCRTLRLTEEVSLNIGPGDELVGIEILDAKEVLGKGTAYSCFRERSRCPGWSVIPSREVLRLPCTTVSELLVGHEECEFRMPRSAKNKSSTQSSRRAHRGH